MSAKTTSSIVLPDQWTKSGKLSRRGFHINKDTTLQEWRQIGESLVEMHDATQFWIGDWINFGKANYGEKYKLALEILPYEYQSLANIAFVCAHVPASQRRDDLTFAHHRETLSLPAEQRVEFLAAAAKDKLSVTKLRALIRVSTSEYGEERAAESGGRRFNVVRWTHEGVRWFKRELASNPIEKWSPRRRALLKQDLQPLIDVYHNL